MYTFLSYEPLIEEEVSEGYVSVVSDILLAASRKKRTQKQFLHIIIVCCSSEFLKIPTNHKQYNIIMTDDGTILPADLLHPSPSARDNVESTEELLHRAFGCELIQEGGILLRLPQVVMATGQNLLHRFFYRFMSRLSIYTS